LTNTIVVITFGKCFHDFSSCFQISKKSTKRQSCAVTNGDMIKIGIA